MNTSKYAYASYAKRMLAHNTDILILVPAAYGLSAIIDDDIALYIAILALYILYHLFFEISPMRATPGKRIAKLKVKSEGENEVLRIIARNLSKPISMLPLFLGYTLVMFNRKHKALHDFIASTVVVEEL